MRYYPHLDDGRAQVAPADLYRARKSEQRKLRNRLAASRRKAKARMQADRLRRAKEEEKK